MKTLLAAVITLSLGLGAILLGKALTPKAPVQPTPVTQTDPSPVTVNTSGPVYGSTVAGPPTAVGSSLTIGTGSPLWQIGASSTLSNSFTIGNVSQYNPYFNITTTGQSGFGSTSPWGLLSIHANNGDVNKVLFAIGSSTASATSTLLSVDNTGILYAAQLRAGATSQTVTNTSGIISPWALSSSGTNVGLVIRNATETTNNTIGIYFSGASASTDTLKSAILSMTNPVGWARQNMLFALNNTANGNNTAYTDTRFGISSFGHISLGLVNSGNAATVNTCGSGPSLSGTDSSGVITFGTGALSTCNVQFATAYGSSNVICVGNLYPSDKLATATVAHVIEASTTGMKVGSVASNLGGSTFRYACFASSTPTGIF